MCSRPGLTISNKGTSWEKQDIEKQLPPIEMDKGEMKIIINTVGLIVGMHYYRMDADSEYKYH